MSWSREQVTETLRINALKTRFRREQLAAANLCVNDNPNAPKHGPRFRGGRCESCWTRKKNAERLGPDAVGCK